MLRRYTVLDYNTIKVWADARQFPLLPQEFLPATGFIHEGHCVGFLYKSDSKICWLEWLISNPDSDKAARDKAMNELINSLIGAAKSSGYEVIFTSVEHKGLINRYQAHGFMTTDTNMTNMIRRV